MIAVYALSFESSLILDDRTLMFVELIVFDVYTVARERLKN